MDAALQSVIEHCAPMMDRKLMSALVRRESNGNRFAIGMDGGAAAIPQPKGLSEAVFAANKLIKDGKTFSVGLAQIHISNIRLLGVPLEQAFDECTSVRHGQLIYQKFFAKAVEAGFRDTDAVFAALRGYNSGSIFAPISNSYATRIMSEAAIRAARVLPVSRNGTVRRVVAIGSPVDANESIELFNKQ